jgi:hypothetical protein
MQWLIQKRYQSQFQLLEAMAIELAEALEESGVGVESGLDRLYGFPGTAGAHEDGVALFFNFPARFADLPAVLRSPGSPIALVQFVVDHPLAVDPLVMDGLSKLSHYRLVLPCVDSSHLLRLRWPGLAYTHCFHALPPRALAEEASIERRWTRGPLGAAPVCDVVVAGSIHGEKELGRVRASVPAHLRPAREALVAMLVESPTMPFEQAADLVLSSMGHPSGDWGLLSAMWRGVTPEVNRLRRVELVRSLQGLDAIVYGAEAWTEFCTGTIRYGGNVAYRDLPSVLAHGRTCLAWGPTQFAHSFSERLLLSLAAGCATITDDRWLARQVFPSTRGRELVHWYDPAMPRSARDAIERALAFPAASIEMACRGRSEVASKHLWRHRLPLLTALAEDARTSGALSAAA